VQRNQRCGLGGAAAGAAEGFAGAGVFQVGQPEASRPKKYAPKAYIPDMLTVVETPLFQRQWPFYWSEDERAEFAVFMATKPEAGVLVPDSGGVRKVRWKRQGTGKSGGVRVIYFVKNQEEEIVLLTLYAKAKTDNLTGPVLKEIRRALEQ
jgi:mRNA-degrading endonuclease RelE of RelBE toxin-antitoxin system